jgi:putative oxidoreductase
MSVKDLDHVSAPPHGDRRTAPAAVLARPARRVKWLAPLVLRAGVGMVMVIHGAGKLDDNVGDAWAPFFKSLDIPAPTFMAWVVAIIEVIGGICVLAGLLTRVWALLFAGVMVGAIWLVSYDLGFRSGPDARADLNIALLAGALALVLLGPGRVALDRVLGIDE